MTQPQENTWNTATSSRHPTKKYGRTDVRKNSLVYARAVPKTIQQEPIRLPGSTLMNSQPTSDQPTSFCANYRPQKSDPYRVRCTLGGNLINYPGSKSSPTASIPLVKLLINSVLSTPCIYGPTQTPATSPSRKPDQDAADSITSAPALIYQSILKILSLQSMAPS